ncbi:hypothetical protein J3R82DRAFT_6770 [Butyriboletus roseoflavus]|nr:hypothetical protein J3R82DRAFT_6770 [Butyriboletus roseoflavus]
MLSPARCLPSRPLAHHVRLASSTVPTPRGGRNLTERYRTLEHTNRAKSAERASHVSLLSQRSASAAELQPNVPVPARRPTTVKTIAGFIVPEEPLTPADDGVLDNFCASLPLFSTTDVFGWVSIECCMSGCGVCVYDLYEEALVAYKDSVATLRAALSALHIPETQWPAHILTGTVEETHAPPTTTEKSKDAVLGAFEEMERALKEKRDKRAAAEAESSF